MPRLTEVWDYRDDWTGVTGAAERRKRQNRLNQRVYRRRRHLERCAALSSDDKSKPDHNATEILSSSQDHPAEPSHDLIRSQSAPRDVRHRHLHDLILKCYPKAHEEAFAYIQRLITNYSLHGPTSGSLPVLACLNVINALAINALALNFPFEQLYYDDCISPFNLQGPSPQGVSAVSVSVPDCLHPTKLQRTMAHHPWVDLFPIPGLRDNILRGLESGVIDEDKLCCDMMRTENSEDAVAPVVVWGQAWDVRCWEFSTDFVKKWGWLIQDCPEVLEATNAWREKRGKAKIRCALSSRVIS